MEGQEASRRITMATRALGTTAREGKSEEWEEQDTAGISEEQATVMGSTALTTILGPLGLGSPEPVLPMELIVSAIL